MIGLLHLTQNVRIERYFFKKNISREKMLMRKKSGNLREKKAKDILLTGAPTTSSWEEEESRQNKYESKLKRSIVRQKVAQFL